VEVDRLRREVADLQNELAAERSGPHRGLFSAEWALREQGLEDPALDLVKDLQPRSDLIPVPGVLGGTMAFRRTADWVVTDRWVLAHIDDGHTGGTLLLEYAVTDGGIKWTLADYVMDGAVAPADDTALQGERRR